MSAEFDKLKIFLNVNLLILVIDTNVLRITLSIVADNNKSYLYHKECDFTKVEI